MTVHKINKQFYFFLTATLDDAIKKREFFIDGISDIETDNSANEQNLKNSRHSRKVKPLDSDFTDGERGSTGLTTNRKFAPQLKNMTNVITSERSKI